MHREVGVLLLEILRQPFGHDFGLDVRDLAVERDVKLQAFGAGCLGPAIEAVLGEQVAEHKTDAAALDDRCGRSRVEVENQRARLRQLVRVRKRGMEFERCNLGKPHQCGQVLAEAVVHVAVVAPAPDSCRLDPRRPVLRTVLLIEELGVDAVRVALQR